MSDSVPLQVSDSDSSSNSQPKAQIGPDGLPVVQNTPATDVEQAPAATEFDPEAEVPVTEDGLQIDPNATDETAPGDPKRVRRMATIMNMLNSLLGAGILSVPASLKQAGIFPSLIILLIIAILSHIGTVLTIKLQYRTNAGGLDDLAEKLTGRWGSLVLSILSMIFCISAMTGYLVIGGNSICTFLSLANDKIKWLDDMWIRFGVVLVYSLCVPIALICPRSVAFLSPFSFATVICIVIFFLAIIVEACIWLPKGVGEGISLGKFDMGIFSAIGIYSLSFALPVVVLPIIAPYNPDLHKRGIISAWTCGLCYVLVAIPAVLGYVIKGEEIKADILDSFDPKDWIIIICRIGFLLVVSFSYPCLGQSLLSSWSQVIYHENNHGILPWSKRIVVLVCANIIPLILACFLPQASPALAVGGALGGCVVDFFYPSVMWVILSKKPWTHYQNLLCIAFAAFGIIIGGISTYQAIVDAIAAFSK